MCVKERERERVKECGWDGERVSRECKQRSEKETEREIKRDREREKRKRKRNCDLQRESQE